MTTPHQQIPGSEPYSFCETVTAGPTTPWHIRRLTEAGRRLGGAADTPALCGRAVSWDLQVTITPHHLGHACPECGAALRRALLTL